MSLYSIFQSIQSTSFMTWVEQTPWVYPIIMATHLSCVAVFGGMILMTDLRLLGVALRDQSIADVVGGLRPFKRIGFVIMVACGLLMAGSEAPTYYPNPYFWAKMALLVLVGVHAFIFKPIVYDHPEELDLAPVIPTRAKAAAMLSLALWVSIPICGRLIGYYEPKEGKAPQAARNFIAPLLLAHHSFVADCGGSRPSRCAARSLPRVADAITSLWRVGREKESGPDRRGVWRASNFREEKHEDSSIPDFSLRRGMFACGSDAPACQTDREPRDEGDKGRVLRGDQQHPARR